MKNLILAILLLPSLSLATDIYVDAFRFADQNYTGTVIMCGPSPAVKSVPSTNKGERS